MIPDPFTHNLTAALLGDRDCAELLSAERLIARMVEVEAALASCQGEAGIIPQDAAAAIRQHLVGLTVDPARLAAGLAKDGVPIPALLTELRKGMPAALAGWLHWGATSQDIVDTAMVLALRDVADLLISRLNGLARKALALALAHADTPIAARTRMQVAVPTSLGLTFAGWADALDRRATAMQAARREIATLQLGGAAGNLAVLGAAGPQLIDSLAAALGLAAPALPWHTHRDRMVGFGQALTLTAGVGGKIGQDLILLGQSEVAELKAGTGGGSSTMPNKANPVLAEGMVALARMAAARSGELAGAMLQALERDGAAWTQEWLVLPGLAMAACAVTSKLDEALETLSVDVGRMRANLLAGGAPALAEAASFALSVHMPRAQASALVAQAAAAAVAQGIPLPEILRGMTDAPLDWAKLSDPASHIGPAHALIARLRARLDRAADS